MIAYNNAKFYISENQSETNINDQSVIFVKIKGRELKNLAYPVTYTISNLEVRYELYISIVCLHVWMTVNVDFI